MPGSEDVSETVQGLSGSLAGRLAPLWPEIEAKMAVGVKTPEIVEALNKSGIDVSLVTFRTYLQRHRKAVRKKGGVAQVQPVTQAAVLTGQLKTTTTENGNSPSEQQTTPEAEIESSGTALDDVMDAEKRTALTDNYVNLQRPIFGSKPK